jgi:hypothetical protein
MDEYGKDLLRTGIIEAKAGNKEGARRYLDRALYMAGAHEVLAEAWFWMSQVVDDPADQRKALENCLAHDLHHARARRALGILDGKLKADEVVDPDRLPPVPDCLRQSEAQRFMCPKCGGRMSYAPDGGRLVCDYCTRDQLPAAGPAAEKDFILSMATARGHGRPLQEQTFHCKGCGAGFFLPPKQLSASCVYCDSPHVVSLEGTRDLLAPDAIIPHAFGQERATELLIEWVEGNGIAPQNKVNLPRGLYLPLWTFDIGGAIDYTGERLENDELGLGGGRGRIVRVADRHPILVNDLPIPASRKTSAVLLKLIPTFEMKAARPYDPRYLAGWPAEIYDVAMAEASLDARSRGYAQCKDELPYLVGDVQLVHTSSSNLVIESFKLNLLPVWMTELPLDGRLHLVLINGQNGIVASDLPGGSEGPKEGKTGDGKGGLKEFLSDLLDEA